MPLLNRVGGSSPSGIKGIDADFIAQDKLKIGDVVYTIDGDLKDNPNIPNLGNNPTTAAFSPSGTELVLGGSGGTFTAKIYSVSGTTITYVKDIYADAGTTPLSNIVSTAVFSPDGTKLVLGGFFTGYAKIYSVSGTTITYVKDIYADAGTTALSSVASTATFSPDGTKLVLGGSFVGRAKIYSISGTNVTYVADIKADAGSTVLSSSVSAAVFSPDNAKLVLGGAFAGFAKIYSVSGTTVTYVKDIYADAGTTALTAYVSTAVFSPDGTKLVLGGNFTGYAKIYSVSGTTITYVSNIYLDAGTTALNALTTSASFASGSTRLILSGNFTGFAKIYSVSGAAATYVADIKADAGTTALDGNASIVAFSPNGLSIVLGGNFAGKAKGYSVSGTTVTYATDIKANTGTTVFNGSVTTVAFSPDGLKLVLGGYFTGKAKIYSVSGKTLTYISDIYANLSNTPLNNYVSVASFSPDGLKLILGGSFDYKAKIYSVNGTTVAYVADIKGDASGLSYLNNSVYAISFSSDGTKMVLGGEFEGKAKIYSVSGTTVTYVADIKADAGSTALTSSVGTLAISPNGTKLALGGFFDGYGKFYNISGTTVTFLSNIPSNAGAVALDNIIRSLAFSPDSSKLVIGGAFEGKAKIYSISGNTLTYVDNIKANAGGSSLSGETSAVAFSPDGLKLILGGSFTGNAKIYSVSGTTVTYVADIYANVGTATFNASATTIAFSPDGLKLILGGPFTGSAKAYIVNGTTITYAALAYKYNLNLFSNPTPPSMAISKIGIVKQDTNVGNKTTVTVIASP